MPEGHGSAAERFDRQIADRCLKSGRHETAYFEDMLQVLALPLELHGQRRGCVVYGWAFDRFSSSTGCAKLGRKLGMSGGRLWTQARREPPIGTARAEVFTKLLETLISSNAKHIEAIVRLQELGRTRDIFLARVSHELRTPLHTLQMRIELLLNSDLSDPEVIRSALHKMKPHLEQEAALVEDLIDAARTMTGKLSIALEPTSLSTVLHESVGVLRPKAEEKNIGLILSDSSDTTESLVNGDPRRLQQVFSNLLQNAVKFTPTGGTLRASLQTDEQQVEITVQDTGEGLEPSVAPHIFEAFTKKAEDNDTGLGLGLAIAREIVQVHGGTLRATSSGRNQGTTFTVVVPRLKPPPS